MILGTRGKQMATVNRDILRPYLDEYRKYLNRQKRGENVRQLSRSLSVLSVSLWLSFICVSQRAQELLQVLPRVQAIRLAISLTITNKKEEPKNGRKCKKSRIICG